MKVVHRKNASPLKVIKALGVPVKWRLPTCFWNDSDETLRVKHKELTYIFTLDEVYDAIESIVPDIDGTVGFTYSNTFHTITQCFIEWEEV